MRTIICGAPDWTFDNVIRDEIVKCHVRARRKKEALLIIHGDDNGPDVIINKICNEVGIDQVIYPAIRTMGHSGWLRRNKIMLQENDIDLVILFSHTIREGTVIEDMKIRAEDKRIPVSVIDYKTLMNRNSTEIDADPLGSGGF